jgi:Co/Zn/Cd efflux system component
MAAATPTARANESTTSNEETATPTTEVSAVYDMGPQLSRGAVFGAVMSNAVDQAKPEKKGNRCTPNIRALSVSAFLFSLITVAQYFAAIAANSQALKMDCISMAVDAFTYMGNIVVECRKRDGAKHVTSQLVVVACSLSMLALFTILAMQESWDTVQVCMGKKEAEGDEDEVNGWITLAFAIGGVAFDIACIVEFYRSNRKVQSAKQVNMFSALLHVGADFLRSISTTVMSLLILLAHVDSGCADAYTSIIIGVSILCGAAVGFFKWVKLLFSFFIKGEIVQ